MNDFRLSAKANSTWINKHNNSKTETVKLPISFILRS